MSEQLTAQQRANLFAMSTRQNRHCMSKQRVTTPNTTIDFTIPKARFMSNILVRCKAIVKAKHASQTKIDTTPLTANRLLRRVSLDLNNGFAPFSISGEGLALLNILRPNSQVFLEKNEFNNVPKELVVSSAGAENELVFTIQLQNTLNNRDLVGLILAQNESTIINLKLDLGSPMDMYPEQPEGFEFDLVSFEALPMLETFSIPSNPNHIPDMSILKLCNDVLHTINTSGQNEILIPCNTIYRKLILFITDDLGQPVEADWITSNIDLVFNGADTNYSINADMLRALNVLELGCDIPKGVFIFDFCNQGLSNYAGTRDYIDSTNLTEFKIRLNTQGKGKVKVITECLSRLV